MFEYNSYILRFNIASFRSVCAWHAVGITIRYLTNEMSQSNLLMFIGVHAELRVNDGELLKVNIKLTSVFIVAHNRRVHFVL